MAENTHPRELPLAPIELQDKYMNQAGEFVLGKTSIGDDSMQALKKAGFQVGAALTAGQLVMYMAIYAIAEYNAHADGYTLRDYAMAEKINDPKANFVPGTETRN